MPEAPWVEVHDGFSEEGTGVRIGWVLFNQRAHAIAVPGGQLVEVRARRGRIANAQGIYIVQLSFSCAGLGEQAGSGEGLCRLRRLLGRRLVINIWADGQSDTPPGHRQVRVQPGGLPERHLGLFWLIGKKQRQPAVKGKLSSRNVGGNRVVYI